MTKKENVLSDKDLLRLQRLRLMDDDFMNVCLQENKEAVKEMLEVFLPGKELTIQSVQTQYVIKNLYGRSVELDIHAKEKSGRRFNVEVQREGKGARPKRARYHASLLDASSIKSGKKVEKLPENYVIFITEKDYFGCGEPIYHIDRMVQEKNVPFGDGSHILYVNGAYKGNDTIGRLMHDFRCSNPEDMYSDTLREAAKYFKETEEGQRKMGKVLDEIRQEGIDMGKEIGKEIGEKLGKEIGLKCFVRTVKDFFDDFEGVYNAVIKNEEYRDFTREDVMKYYI